MSNTKRQWCIICALGLSMNFAVAQPETMPSVIEVFVLSDQASHVLASAEATAAGTEVHLQVVDAVDRWERDLSAGLPRDPDAALAHLQQATQAMTDDDRQRLVGGWQALRRASALGIESTPAIVLNQEAVIYGVTNLDDAIRLWREHRS